MAHSPSSAPPPFQASARAAAAPLCTGVRAHHRRACHSSLKAIVMQSFQHRQSAHCESGVLSAMLTHKGLPLSEPMVFGLSSALAFAYIPLVKLAGMPLIAYRMPPGWIIRGMRKRLGIKLQSETFRNPAQARRALDRKLDEGELVGLQTGVFWLPYFPEEMRFHFNAHNLIVYGREHDDYLISDPVFEYPSRCASDALERARFAKGALAPKGMMYSIETIPQNVDFSAAIKGAIRANFR